MGDIGIIASSEEVLQRLDFAVQQLTCSGSGPSSRNWHEELEKFASCAAELEVILRTPRAPVHPLQSDEQCQNSIVELEKELQAKDELLNRTHQQVKQWQKVCDELKQQYEAKLFSKACADTA